MQLPPVRRLIVEDFPSQKGWIDRLLYPLNQFLTSMATGLQNGLTFQENILSQIQTVTISNNTAEFPILFKWNFHNKPQMVFMNAFDVSTIPQPFSSAVFPTWVYLDASKQIQVSSITGLVANQKYSLTFLVI